MILILVMVSAVAGLLAAEWADSKFAIGATKMTAATTFIVVALSCGALESTYGQILLAGLALCWLGDACLLSPGQSLGFQLGIAAFLLGHLAYAVAFFELGIDPIGLAAGGLLMSGFAAGMLHWLRPRVPDDFQVAVISYIGVISLMVACAIGVVVAGGPPIVAIGAIGFTLSDISVARARFVSPGFINAAWGLPLYFASQFLLASSAAFASPAIS
jgi:uncharacterized membrane protein YhhN